MGKRILSSTKWETSEFGGYKALIHDHPLVHVEMDITYNLNRTGDLAYVNASKLMDIFLLKVKEFRLILDLISDAEIEKQETFFGSKDVALINKSQQRYVLQEIINKEKEYRSLFIHYSDTILSSDIIIKLPKNKFSDGEDDEDNSGHSKGDKKSEKKDKDKKEDKKEKSGLDSSDSGEKEDSDDGKSKDSSGKGKKSKESKKGKDKSGEEEGEGDGEGENSKSDESKESEDSSTPKDGKDSKDSKGHGKEGKEGSSDEGEDNDGEINKSKKGAESKGTPTRKYNMDEVLDHIEDLVKKTKKWEPFSSKKSLINFRKETKWIYPNHHIPREKIFSNNEEFLANQLVKLLDINFDPNEDRLNSLRNGKLDQRKIGEVLPGNLNVYYKIEENQTTKPFSIVILQDESGSMGGTKMNSAISILKILYLAFREIVPPNKLSVYGHSGGSRPEIYIYKDPYNDTFEKTIHFMMAKSENYDGPVIEAIYDKVRSYTNDNIIFIVLSDGQPAGSGYGSEKDIIDLRRIVEKCRRDGFVTVGLGIHYNTGRLYDYNCYLDSTNQEMIKKTSYIINKVVKTEFQ